MEPSTLLCPWDFPDKSTGVGCHFLLQRIFPTQGSNLGLPHCKQTLYRLSHQGSRPGNEHACNAGEVRDVGLIPSWEDPLEERMETYSSILAGESHG